MPDDILVLLDDDQFDWLTWRLPKHAEWLAESALCGGDHGRYFKTLLAAVLADIENLA